jgi:hypothetical protein
MNDGERYDWEELGGFEGVVKEIRRLSPNRIFSNKYLAELAPTRLIWLYYDVYNEIHNPGNEKLVLK